MDGGGSGSMYAHMPGRVEGGREDRDRRSSSMWVK